MKSIFGYANDLICVDSIHLICLACEVLQLKQWLLTQSKRRGVSKQMLSSPDAERMPMLCLPLLWQLQTHPKVVFFAEHVLLVVMGIFPPLSVSRGAAGDVELFETGGKNIHYLLLLYKSFLPIY